VEQVKINLIDTNTAVHAAFADTLTLASTTLSSVTVAGTGTVGFTLNDTTDTVITSVNASGMTNSAGTAGTGFNWTSGALTTAVSVVGSLKGGDVINLAAATKAVTITETAGANTITGSATFASILTGGSGADIINGGAGKDTIIGGNGADVIKGGAGADLITVAGNTSTIVHGAGDSGINATLNTAASELTANFDVIRGLTAGDKINLGTIVTNAANGVITSDLVLANTNLAGTANKVVFAAGTYDAANGIFTYGAAGLDTALTFNDTGIAGGTNFETIILVGYHAGATTSAAAGVITLA
jgi:Ca2+-binding RTX toxin-like protein